MGGGSLPGGARLLACLLHPALQGCYSLPAGALQRGAKERGNGQEGGKAI